MTRRLTLVGRGIGVGGRRLDALDGVRGLAIAMVVLFHLTNRSPTDRLTGLVGHVTGAGWLGVELFFVLSAFLITSLLAARPSGRDFVLRRARRIAPMYAVVLVAFIVVAPIVATALREGNPDGLLAEAIPRNGGIRGIEWSFVLFVQNFWMAARNGFLHPVLSVTWSLAVEVQFYVAWYFLMRQREDIVRRVAIAAIVAGPLFRFAMALAGSEVTRIYVLPFSHLDLFGWGTLLALSYRSGVPMRWLRSGRFVALSIGGLGVWGLLAHRVVGTTGYTPWQLSIGITLMGLAAAASLHRILTGGGVRAARVLGWRPLTALGVISYSLYLLHNFAALLFRIYFLPKVGLDQFVRDHEFAGQLIIYVGTGTLAVVASTVTYLLVEKPFMRGRRHAVLTAPAAPVPAPV